MTDIRQARQELVGRIVPPENLEMPERMGLMLPSCIIPADAHSFLISLTPCQRRASEHFDQDGGNSVPCRRGCLADPTDQALAVNSADLIQRHLAVLPLEGE